MIELTLAMGITVALIGTLAVMTDAVQQSQEYGRGYGSAVQHARVALERIDRALTNAYAVDRYPGAWVFAETESGYRFPDMLLVWRPAGAPANPTGPPRVNELVLFCPNPSAPGQLLEITSPNDTSAAPASDDSVGWQALATQLRDSDTAERTVITGLLQTAIVPEVSATALRGCLRFERVLMPSESEYDSYQGGSTNWEDMSWPLDMYGSKRGVRNVWVRYEAQLQPGVEIVSNAAEAMPALPFFGSTAFHYELSR